MSDPDVPKDEKPNDVNDVVDSANAGLAEAEAAGADVPDATADTAPDARVDPDLAAFEEAERDYPGTFSAAQAAEAAAASRADAETSVVDDATASETRVFPAAHVHEESAMADAAYTAPVNDAETRVVPSEPVPTPVLQQPIFVQAPEPPRELGNRGTAAGIGLLATLSFAILYLGASLGLGALAGDITGENVGESALAPLTTWGFWVPVAVFFLGFWLLGAIINRGRWGLWVVLGILVGLIAYAGHILGQLFEAPFWTLTAAQGSELVGEQLLAPLAIAAFVFARELTIWFGAWVARSGARKTELNAEAQREYERTLEAGPTLSR
ncbi:MAG: ABC transporter [Microbacterium sp.]|uniref:ABC transporter n=1 Tax=Microbacterium sp. TaxID=51671 RepID=UPI003BAFB0D4